MAYTGKTCLFNDYCLRDYEAVYSSKKYQSFGETSYLHLLSSILKIETADSSEALVDFCQNTLRRIPKVHRMRASNLKHVLWCL